MKVLNIVSLFYRDIKKKPNGIMDGFFLFVCLCVFFNNEANESCLSCMWNTQWSSSSSYNFEKKKKVNQKVNLERRPTPARRPYDARPIEKSAHKGTGPLQYIQLLTCLPTWITDVLKKN